MRQAPLGVYVVDADFRILEVNPTALPVFGNIPDLIGRDFDEVIHILWTKEYGDEVVQLFRHTLETGDPYVTPERIEQRVDRDATEYYEWRIDRIPLRDGRFGVVCYFRDISRQVHANEKIARSEERYRALAEQVSDGIFVADSEGRYIDANNAAAALLGYTRDELLNLSIPDLLEPGELERLPEQFERLQNGERVQNDWRFKRKDGSGFIGELVGCGLPEGGFHGVVRDVTARRRAEEALHESEERLRLATEHAEIGFWDVDPINDVLIWPPRVKAMFGISPHVPVSMSDFYNGLHPEDRGKTSEAYAAAADPARRAIYDVEYRTIGREDGLLRWVAAKGRGVFDAAGHCIRFIGTAIDITKRMAIEAALVESEERLRFGMDAARTVAYEWNISTGVSHLSANAGKILGLASGHFDELFSLLHPEDRSTVLAARDAAIAGEADYDLEFPLQLEDGRQVWVNNRARVIRAEGKPGRVVGVLMDVSARKVAEERLRESLERFRTAIGALNNIIWTNNAKGEMEGEQPAWAAFTGQTFEEYQAYGWSKAVHSDDAQPTIDAWSEAVACRKDFIFEHRVRRKDGVWRVCSIRAVPIVNSYGEVKEWVGVHIDITEERDLLNTILASEQALREANENLRASVAAQVQIATELRMANADLEQFAYSASHDLQEPLRSVSIYSELLDKRYRDRLDGQALELLGFLREGAGRMEMLIHDLLAYCQVLEVELPDEETDTEEALQISLANLSEAIASTNAKVTSTELPPPAPPSPAP